MKRLTSLTSVFGFVVFVLFSVQAASADKVKLEGVPFQQVLDRLFGTASTPGLFSTNRPFEFKAENVVLTSDQARSFFVPSATNPADLVDLVSAAEQIKGAHVKIEGQVDGAAFELQLEGREIKLEGGNLTRAQFDALVEQLKAVPGLREAKIESLVDGRELEAKIETRSGRVKIEDGERHHEINSNRGTSSPNRERAERAEHDDKGTRVERVEKVEKIEKPERSEGGHSGRH
jgi:hypothetical protein